MAKRKVDSAGRSARAADKTESGVVDPFNLVIAPWIPVLRSNGRAERVGIQTSLHESGQIRQIAATNPMDNVALLRFLLAVLMWCRPGLSKADRNGLHGAAGVPEKWLGKLKEHEAVFNLLGVGKRFYQDESRKGKEVRPIADLLVEFPGEDSVNHMRHIVHDGSYGFCPACCALGILRLSVWAPANRFYPASVNPGSAAYAVVQENSLLQTLFANLPSANAQAEQAPWVSSSTPDSPGAVARLAWRPRTMWLNVGSEQGSCAYCGRSGVLIVSLCNGSGWPTPTTAGRTKKFWEGDQLLLKEDEPIALPELAADAAAHSSRFWRDSLRLCQKEAAKRVAVGPVVKKFTFHDAMSIDLLSASARTRADLTGRCADRLSDLRKQITPNPDRQHPEINAAFVLMTPDTEARIRAALHGSHTTTDDVAFLNRVYQPAVMQVVASTVPGSPLRRREAVARARSALDAAIQKATEPPKIVAKGDKPKRSRTKKGGSA